MTRDERGGCRSHVRSGSGTECTHGRSRVSLRPEHGTDRGQLDQTQIETAQCAAHRTTRSARHGFALPDAVTLTAGLALVAVIGLPALHSFRTEARLAASRDNLRQMGKANDTYGAEHEDTIATFDLQYVPTYNGGFGPGPMPVDIGGFTVQVTDNIEAGVAQLAGIVRRRSGRIGGTNTIRQLNQITPNPWYDHLMLVDYLDGDVSSPLFVSPLDVHLQEFQSMKEATDYRELPGGTTEFCYADARWARESNVPYWAYASSYAPTTYAHSPSRPLSNGQLASRPVEDDGTLQFNVPDHIKPQRRDHVAFPSRKAWRYERFDFTAGTGASGKRFDDPTASVNVLAFDGSVSFVPTAEANPGWDPSDPTNMTRTAMIRNRTIDSRYFPGETNQPDPRPGYYKWTRGGLEGIDFGAGEINTSDW